MQGLDPVGKGSSVSFLRGGLTYLLGFPKVHRSYISGLMNVYTLHLLIISSRQRPFPVPRGIAQAPSGSHSPHPHHHQRERRSDQACR